jgi:hypothetical protein
MNGNCKSRVCDRLTDDTAQFHSVASLSGQSDQSFFFGDLGNLISSSSTAIEWSSDPRINYEHDYVRALYKECTSALPGPSPSPNKNQLNLSDSQSHGK